MGRRKSKSKHGKPKKGKETQAAAAASSSAQTPPPPPWVELPGDITANILQRLGAVEILERAQKVCTAWWRVCKDPAMWRVIDMMNPEHWETQYGKMCRNAVDRSQGQVVDISITYFGDDELLDYIADRSSHLRRLQMNSCYDISGETLVNAVKKLPHLEELHLTIMPSVCGADVEAIGISCPQLKSFAYNERGSKYRHPQYSEYDDFFSDDDYDNHALAIAKTMPNLLHLQLFAHWMKNEELEAILDGCPHLESLDIRQSFKLDLEGDLGKRCFKQIKNLRHPSDSISDIWWLAYESIDPFEAAVRSYESDFFDEYHFDCSDGYYEDFEQYDDYTSPFGVGFFGHDGAWIFDADFI